MKIPDIIIAIDGYSSTGKSTVAKMLAKEYSLLYWIQARCIAASLSMR